MFAKAKKGISSAHIGQSQRLECTSSFSLSATCVWHVPHGYFAIYLISLGGFVKRVNDIAIKKIIMWIAVIVKVNGCEISAQQENVFLIIIFKELHIISIYLDTYIHILYIHILHMYI